MLAVNKNAADTQKLTPASGVETVTPSDSTQLTYVSWYLYVGAGHVSVLLVDGTTVTLSACPWAPCSRSVSRA